MQFSAKTGTPPPKKNAITQGTQKKRDGPDEIKKSTGRPFW